MKTLFATITLAVLGLALALPIANASSCMTQCYGSGNMRTCYTNCY